MDTDAHGWQVGEGRRAGASRLERCALHARPSAPVREPLGSRPVASVLAPGVRIAIFSFGGDRYRSGTDGFRCISGIRIHLVNICIHPFLVVEDLRANRPGERGRGDRTGSRGFTDGSRGRAQRRGSAAAAQRPPGPRFSRLLSVSICVHLWFLPLSSARAVHLAQHPRRVPRNHDAVRHVADNHRPCADHRVVADEQRLLLGAVDEDRAGADAPRK
jgi:hypothetical protein